MDLYDRLALAVGHKPPPVVSLIGNGVSYAALIAILALAALPSLRPTADAWLASRGFPGRVPDLAVLAPAYIAFVFLIMGHHRLVERRAELLGQGSPRHSIPIPRATGEPLRQARIIVIGFGLIVGAIVALGIVQRLL